jgi:hypothetical protein
VSAEGRAEIPKYPRDLDSRSSLTSGSLLIAGSMVVLVSLAIPWATLRGVTSRGASYVVNWTPEGNFSPTMFVAAIAVAATITFAFGLNRLGVLHLWRWLQLSALWPMIALWYLTGVIGNQGVSSLSGTSGEALFVSYAVEHSIGPYVAGIGVLLVTFAAIIEGQSRRRTPGMHRSQKADRRLTASRFN